MNHLNIKKIFFSTTTHPAENAALEESMLYQAEKDSSSYLLIYRNTPCVVMGKFQNPWLESNLGFLRQHQIPLMRRISGGGCVFHDLENINFAMIAPKKNYIPEKILQEFIFFLTTDFNIDLKLGEKFDLLCDGKKVSGSAMRQTKDKVLHHFTMLIDSDLLFLSQALRPTLPKEWLQTSALSSRRSKVVNLKSICPRMNSVSFLKYFRQKMQVDTCCEDLQYVPSAHLSALAQKYQSWDFTFGATPSFVFCPPHFPLIFSCSAGQIISIKNHQHQEFLQAPIKLDESWASRPNQQLMFVEEGSQSSILEVMQLFMIGS